jgi:tripartite-type tricarboxylate transporter receptor subunit TctC
VLNKLVSFGIVLISATQSLSPAMAQDFPTKQPIKIVVPVPPGGGTDGIARVTAAFLQRRLGQSVIVDNKPGASSTIGADFVYKAPADGYTILLTGAEFAVVPAVRNVPYKMDQFTYLIRGYTVQPMLFLSPKSPLSTFPEFLAEMKAKPDQLKFGSTGIGAIVHVGVSMFESAAGVKALHVPYSGISPVYNDLFGGQIDFSMGTTPLPDNLKIIASAGPKRNPAYPNTPTLEEFGVHGGSWELWFGFMAPPNLPKPIADRLITEISAVLKDPEAIAKYKQVMDTPPDQAPLTGEAFKKQTLEDNRNWKSVVQREKIVLQ